MLHTDIYTHTIKTTSFLVVISPLATLRMPSVLTRLLCSLGPPHKLLEFSPSPGFPSRSVAPLFLLHPNRFYSPVSTHLHLISFCPRSYPGSSFLLHPPVSSSPWILCPEHIFASCPRRAVFNISINSRIISNSGKTPENFFKLISSTL